MELDFFLFGSFKSTIWSFRKSQKNIREKNKPFPKWTNLNWTNVNWEPTISQVLRRYTITKINWYMSVHNCNAPPGSVPGIWVFYLIELELGTNFFLIFENLFYTFTLSLNPLGTEGKSNNKLKWQDGMEKVKIEFQHQIIFQVLFTQNILGDQKTRTAMFL